MRRRIALFDFDGTLTRHDTFITFARHACGRSRFLKAFVRSLPALVRWKLGLGTNSKAKETLFGNLYRGMAADEFERLCATFADVVVHDLNESGMRLLDNHLRAGDEVYIVSASPGAWIRPWSQRLGIKDVIATEIEIDTEGRLTGRFSTPNCHGAEKVRRVAAALGPLSGYESWAYGDSDSDRFILDAADHSEMI